MFAVHVYTQMSYALPTWWLGLAMVLGNFQCRVWHMVGQGPAVLAAGAGWVGFVFFFLFVFFCFF